MYLDQLRQIDNITIIVRVMLALVVGGIIGIERGRKNHPAGFRTYMVVCLGSTLVMMTNQYMFQTFAGGDISRLGAQVISGIGFLGAGTIVVTRKNQVRGLTTAAGLWSAACIGLAIGIGFYEGAVISALAIIFIMTILQKLEYFVQSKSALMHVYLNTNSQDTIEKLISCCKENDYKVLDMQISKDKEAGNHSIALVIFLKLKRRTAHFSVLKNISEVEGVNHLEEL